MASTGWAAHYYRRLDKCPGASPPGGGQGQSFEQASKTAMPAPLDGFRA